MIGKWITVTAQNPCRKCGKPDWCARSNDGRAEICRRVGRSDGIHKIDSNGADYWLYRLDGNGTGGGYDDSQEIETLPSFGATIHRAEAAALDAVYRVLLAELSLSDFHRENLLGRGLTDEQITGGMYRSWPNVGSAAICRRVREKIPAKIDLLTVPGFYRKIAKNGKSYLSLTGAAGMTIPVRDESGRIVALKIRADTTTNGNRYFYVSSANRGGAGSGAPLYFPVGFDEYRGDSIRFTEGELKAYVSTVLSGIYTVSVPGVLQWRAALDWLKAGGERFKDTKIIVAFDSDSRENPHVARAVKDFTMSLVMNGFQTEIETWPVEFKGIDDALAAGAEIRRISDPDEVVCTVENWEKQARAKHPEAAAAVPAGKPPARSRRKAAATVPTGPGDSLDESWFAEFFVKNTIETLRFVREKNEWIWFDGKKWTSDCKEQIRGIHKKKRQELYRLAAERIDTKKADEFIKFAKLAGSQRFFTAVMQLASMEMNVGISVDSFDKNQYLLNCVNGMIDLESGKLWPHDKGEFITKMISVEYDPAAKCPRWERFLSDIFNNDENLISFVQRAIGYSLNGCTNEQCFFILWGIGSNGKSTFIKIIERLLGDFSITMEAESIANSKKNAGNASPDIASLPGKRLAVVCESGKGMSLNEGLVKQLSGGDRVTARALFRDYFQFDPTFKLFILTNHKPVIRGTDTAIWRRIKLIPFTQSFTGERCDKNLYDKLLSEIPGILAWAVRGAVEWKRSGLGQAKAVESATTDYRLESDLIGRFIKECCVTSASQRIYVKELYEKYVEWCEGNGDNPIGSRTFSNAFKEKGFSTEAGTGNKYRWVGIGILPF